MKSKLNLLAAGILLAAINTGLGQPVITQQPQCCTNAVGTTATFSVTATGIEPLAYQWQKLSAAWTDLAGCTGTSLHLTNIQTSHAGDHRVIVTNVYGAATSEVVRLAVLWPPTITSQPRSLAVLFGSNATFRVTAAGTAPLVYQWRLDGRELANATNANLVVSNVALADLGGYAVVVRNASAAATSQPAWLKLARWTQMVAFGDSACMAQYSNGRSWVDWLGELLCLSAPNQIKNYAVGGAGTLAVRAQINSYLSANTPGSNTLLAPWWAGLSADLCTSHLPVAQVVSNYAMNMSLLANAGGRIFVVPNVMPFYYAPRFSGDAYVRSIDYTNLNARMDREVQILRTNFGLTIFRFNMYDLVVGLWANPAAYGFTNLTGAANGCVGCDRSQYFWWDDVHASAAGHRFMGTEMYRCLTPPLVIALQTGVPSGLVELQWQGGSPPFRLQRCEDLATGSWRSDELTFATNATPVLSTPHQFFRVLQLGQ
jgi:phospholipase/lecithinase/hemolysin